MRATAPFVQHGHLMQARGCRLARGAFLVDFRPAGARQPALGAFQEHTNRALGTTTVPSVVLGSTNQALRPSIVLCVALERIKAWRGGHQYQTAIYVTSVRTPRPWGLSTAVRAICAREGSTAISQDFHSASCALRASIRRDRGCQGQATAPPAAWVDTRLVVEWRIRRIVLFVQLDNISQGSLCLCAAYAAPDCT